MRIWVYDLFIFHTYSVGIDPIISALLGSNYYLDILLHNNNNNNGNNITTTQNATTTTIIITNNIMIQWIYFQPYQVRDTTKLCGLCQASPKEKTDLLFVLGGIY